MKTFFLLSSLLALAAATPVDLSKRGAFDSSSQLGSITAAQLALAAPGSASCASASFASECHDAKKAAPLLNDAFKKYKQTTLGEIAALVGLMALESGDFQYNENHFPGRPGQGTKAMLMFNFIYDYAYAQEELKEKTLELGGGKKLSLTFDTVSSVPEDKQKAIRAQVLADKYTFGAASWFLTTCKPEVQDGVKKGGFKGFQTYMQDCVGTGELKATDERGVKWCAAVKALKSQGMEMPAECGSA